MPHWLKQQLKRLGLVGQIFIGLLAGVLLALTLPDVAQSVGLLGELFVSALKAIAPVLILVLVTAAIANQNMDQPSHIKPVLVLYLLGTLAAAVVAVVASSLFPSYLMLNVPNISHAAPDSIRQVLVGLLKNIVVNPVSALSEANYIGILAWGAALGLAFRHSSVSTKQVITDFSDAISKIVHGIIALAPIGIFGLVAHTVAQFGLHALQTYAHVLMVLVGCMVFVALVVNPLMVYWKIRRNPYPLVWTCLRESGVTAFFTRSSAANIPVNIELAKQLNLDENTYSVSIPLGATINMAGAAITISVLTLATAHTLAIPVDFLTALLLCVVASICACGVSGIAGGSLLLIPIACGLFGISNDIAMQVVAIGFIIGVIQDSTETALNSSTDIIFTAAVSIAEHEKLQKLP